MSLLSGIYGKSNITQMRDAAQDMGKSAAEQQKLQTGQTLSGKVVRTDADQVTLRLSDGSRMTAKLEGDAQLSPGQDVSFSVKGTSDSQVTLSLLRTNLSQDSAVLKALNASGIPVSDASISLTSSMMDAGMGIDRASLLNMYQQASSFPDVQPKTLVEMQQYGLEVTEENIKGFQAFQNYESGITEGMNDILNRGLSLYEELMTDGQGQDASKLMNALIRSALPQQEGGGAGQTLTDGAGMASGSMDGKIILSDAGLSGGENGILGASWQNGADGIFGAAGQNGADGILGAAGQNGADGIPGAGLQIGLDGIMNTAGQNGTDAALLSAGQAQDAAGDTLLSMADAGSTSSMQMVGDGTAIAQNQDGWQSLPFGARYQMVTQLENAGLDAGKASQLLSEGASSADFLKEVQSLLEQKDSSQQLRSLFGNQEFQSLLKEQAKDTWGLKPEDVSKASVEGFYDKMNKQVKEFTETLSEVARTDSVMGQSLSEMNQNLDFMNQMNQMYQYVQLPLRMNGTETTGDLFVYTDKKSLANKDGEISALLHLDMAYLGPLDVYASLRDGNKVSTRFYLPSDDTLNLIADHISELDSRLEQKGYQVRSEMVRKDQKTQERPVVPELPVETEKTQTIAHHSFNALA